MKKIFSMICLGFSSGLPYMLIFSTLSIWLRDSGIELVAIGFFAWISLTYSLKFLWSPLIDKYSIPILSIFGKRKSWIILMQLLIIAQLLLISFLNPSNQLYVIAIIATLIALAGSFQDIAIDAFRIELSELRNQGNLAAGYQFGYRAAILVATSLALILADEFSWNVSYQLMAILMTIGIIGSLIVPEGPSNKLVLNSGIVNNLAEPIKDFFQRTSLFIACLLLLIIATYRLTDIVMGPMANPFYLDMGFSLTEIGSVVKIVALFASIIGLFFGGILIKKIGIMHSLIVGAFAVMISNLLFALVAVSDKNLVMLSMIVFSDSFSAGMVGTVNIAFLTSLVSKKYTATQYALLTSFMMLPGKLLSGFSGVIASFFQDLTNTFMGWMWFFVFTSSLTLPAIVLIIFFKKNIRLD